MELSPWGVVVAHDVADHAGALVEAALGTVPAVVHRVQHAAVDGLEAVPDVRQRAGDDDGHRVVEIRALHLRLEPDGLDTEDLALFFRRDGGVLVGHGW
ncbi:hypothetical protein GCM10020295_41480 [Streptomyces cinereospinus]